MIDMTFSMHGTSVQVTRVSSMRVTTPYCREGQILLKGKGSEILRRWDSQFSEGDHKVVEELSIFGSPFLLDKPYV